MKVLHWCMLGVTIVLLVCEVTVSQLCKSTITLVDGFHTLFILMRMALPPPPPASNIKLLPYPASPHPASNLPIESSIKPPPSTQSAANGSPTSDQHPVTQATHEVASQLDCHQFFSPTPSPPALDCNVSYTDSRIQPVGAFMSSLVLGSLSISYLIEIISFIMEPQPVQQPLLLVVVGAVSLLCKTLMLWLNWGQLQEDRAETGGQKEAESHVEVNHKVLAAEEIKGLPKQGQVLGDASQAQSVVDNLHHNGALVLCNPGASNVPDGDSKSLEQQQPEVHLHAETPQERLDSEETSGAADLTKDTSETSKDKGHLDNNSQNACKISSVFKSPHHTDSPVRSSRLSVCMLSFIFVVQGLLSALLALINSLVMLLVSPQSKHSSGACSLLVYLDPGLSLLAVITLITVAAPQVHRYGLLLLQATPPHICVSDIGERITRVPGVQAVHDLHVWQLTKSLTVASVHVHCHAGFPAHRCADLMLGVTKVLQSVGVSCCTVQPEFASGSGCFASSGGDPSPVVSREDPSLPLSLTCSLSCGKTCARYMCCSPLEEETKSVAAPPAGETNEEPQTLIIENTFH